MNQKLLLLQPIPCRIRHRSVLSPEEQPPLAPAQAPESSETMPPSKSNNAGRVHSKPPSPLKAFPQSSVASNKSPSASGKASPSQDASSKTSSPAGNASPSQEASSKPSSPAAVAATATAPRPRVASKSPSPLSQTSSKNHPNSKPPSPSRFTADSHPSSSSRSAFPSQASSMPSQSPSRENSPQHPSENTSRGRSPSHFSSKPTAQSTSQQPIESPAAIGDQTTYGITSHPENQSPKARPTSSGSQLPTKSKQSPKPNAKPVESKTSKNQPETKEELTSKNNSNPHSNQDSSKNPIQSDQTIENGLDTSLESQAQSNETKERKNDKSSKSRSSFEPENRDSKQEEFMEDLTKAFQKLNIKYSDKENPKSFTTLIGDNKGASMHLLSGEAKADSSIHIHRQYKNNPDQRAKSFTDMEGNFNYETPQDSRTKEDPPLKLYINTNVQGINNSIMSGSSFTENDPGIKLKFSQEPTKSKDELQSHHARKAKHSAQPAERLTHEPAVRRRCLRGLLMESSDSDLDNPEKPRRHGCRYTRSCKGKQVETL